MMMRTNSNLLVVLIPGMLAVACKKEYDNPPVDYLPVGTVLTIDSLRNLQAAQGSFKFDTDASVYGVVTMDENDGNIYKNVYLQDATGGINVRLVTGGGVYEGDSVRIALRDVYLSKYSGILQLDSCNADINIIKLSAGNSFPSAVVTIDAITTDMESQLIHLDNVQFVEWELSETYADAVNDESADRTLEDSDGNVITVRTSGYASFAGESLASGSGSIACIVSHYNGTIQLYIRNYDDILLDNPRFTGLMMHKNFDDESLTSDGWSVEQVTGSLTWETSTAGGAPDPYASISNYDGANIATESWLISPSLDLTGSASPLLSFENAMNYTGAPLEILISTDYTGGDPSTGTWAALSATLSAGSWVWVNSGDIDLSSYIGSNVHIAFKYTGSDTDGSTWEIDDVMIKG